MKSALARPGCAACPAPRDDEQEAESLGRAQASSAGAASAPAPSAPTNARMPSPKSMLRRGPRPSDKAPNATPALIPASCTIDSWEARLDEAQAERRLQRGDRRRQLADVQRGADAGQQDGERSVRAADAGRAPTPRWWRCAGTSGFIAASRWQVRRTRPESAADDGASLTAARSSGSTAGPRSTAMTRRRRLHPMGVPPQTGRRTPREGDRAAAREFHSACTVRCSHRRGEHLMRHPPPASAA